jgi:hypothetical protein
MAKGQPLMPGMADLKGNQKCNDVSDQWIQSERNKNQRHAAKMHQHRSDTDRPEPE